MSQAALVRYTEDGVLHVVKKHNIRKRKNRFEAKYSDGCYYRARILEQGGTSMFLIYKLFV